LSDFNAFNGQDPIKAFLYSVKKGHCELFAGSMTLMCQSLGLQARMVIGYRCPEYNPFGDYYEVRQSQAHAWVEVLCGGQWQTFDPTSDNEAMSADNAGWVGRMKNVFDYFEYRWGTAVIAYGQENRQNIVQAMDLAIVHSAQNSNETVRYKIPGYVGKLLDRISEIIANPTGISLMMMLMVFLIIAAISYYLYEQWKLRQRVLRIGLRALPAGQRQKLARQLGFYDDLLRLLERRGMIPAPHITPLEFSDHLDFLPNQIYHDIRRLTRLFYRVRFGQSELNAHRRRRVGEAVARLEAKLKS